MPNIAGWLTGEQVPQEVIEQVLNTMGETLQPHSGQPARTLYPGAGLLVFADPAHAVQHNDEPPVLDWIPERRTLIYRRPLSGLHPLYYRENWPAQGNLLFASEIKALCAVGVPRRSYLPALQALLTYGFIPAPWTIFEDIFVVPAGSILRWQRTNLIVNHSTDYHLAEPLPVTMELMDIQQMLQNTSAYQYPSHDEIIALVDGGSASLLAALFAHQYKQAEFPLVTLDHENAISEDCWKQLETLAESHQQSLVSITGSQEADFWLATLAGLEAPAVTMRPFLFHQLLHTAVIETGARIAFCGSGGHLCDQQVPPAIPHRDSSTSIFVWYNQSLKQRSTGAAASLFTHEAWETIQKADPWEQTHHARKLARNAEKLKDEQTAHLYLDLHLRFPDKSVHTAYQLANQERLALRSPYLNPHIIDLLARLPATLEKKVSKEQLLPTLLQRSFWPDYLPVQTPSLDILGTFVESELVRQILAPQAIQKRGIFDPQTVAILRQKARHSTWSRELLLVFTTQLLCQIFDAEVAC